MKQETIIKLTGRIDSNNAREWEQKIMGLLAPETIPPSMRPDWNTSPAPVCVY